MKPKDKVVRLHQSDAVSTLAELQAQSDSIEEIYALVFRDGGECEFFGTLDLWRTATALMAMLNNVFRQIFSDEEDE